MPSLGPLVNLSERAVHRLYPGLGTRPRNGDCVVINIEAELVEPTEPEQELLGIVEILPGQPEAFR